MGQTNWLSHYLIVTVVNKCYPNFLSTLPSTGPALIASRMGSPRAFSPARRRPAILPGAKTRWGRKEGRGKTGTGRRNVWLTDHRRGPNPLFFDIQKRNVYAGCCYIIVGWMRMLGVFLLLPWKCIMHSWNTPSSFYNGHLKVWSSRGFFICPLYNYAISLIWPSCGVVYVLYSMSIIK